MKSSSLTTVLFTFCVQMFAPVSYMVFLISFIVNKIIFLMSYTCIWMHKRKVVWMLDVGLIWGWLLENALKRSCCLQRLLFRFFLSAKLSSLFNQYCFHTSHHNKHYVKYARHSWKVANGSWWCLIIRDLYFQYIIRFIYVFHANSAPFLIRFRALL